MILDFTKEIEAIRALGIEVPEDKAMQLSMVLVMVMDAGMQRERRRCLDIVARKAMNAAAVRAEIERPIR